jgi:hypothetical protein
MVSSISLSSYDGYASLVLAMIGHYSRLLVAIWGSSKGGDAETPIRKPNVGVRQ